MHARELEVLVKLRGRVPPRFGVALRAEFAKPALMGIPVTGRAVFAQEVVPDVKVLEVVRRRLEFLLGRLVAFKTLQL